MSIRSKIKMYDVSPLQKPTKTSQGFLKVPGFATRAGIFLYRGSDGKPLRLLRPADEVFNKDSMESLSSVVMTLRHPPKMIDASNAKQYSVGFGSEKVQKMDQLLRSDLTVIDKEAIESVEAGKTAELSCGYTCDLDETPGKFQGEDYDAVQRNIRYNHLALVEKGRAGPDVRVMLDSAEEVDYIQDEEVIPKPKQENKMLVKMMIGGKEYEVSPELKAAIEAEMSAKDGKFGEVQKEGETMKAAAETQQGKMDALTTEIKTLKEKVKTQDSADSEEKIKARVSARIKLLDSARSRLPKETKLDEMSDLDIKKEVIKSTQSDVVFDGKSEDYISARFDHIIATNEKIEDALDDAGVKLTDAAKKQITDAEGEVEAARKRQEKATEENWKKPL